MGTWLETGIYVPDIGEPPSSWPPLVSGNFERQDRDRSGRVNVLDYAAPGGDDGERISSAIADVGSKGTVIIPGDREYNCLSNVQADNYVGLTLQGQGGPTESAVGGTASAVLRFSGDAYLNAKNSIGLTLDGLQVGHTDAAFAGDLADFQGQTGDGKADTRRLSVRNCQFGGIGVALAGVAAFIGGGYDIEFQNCLFANAAIGVDGLRGSKSSCNGVTFRRCVFKGLTAAAAKNLYTGASFIGCTFEPTLGTSGAVSPILTDATHNTLGLAVIGCWFGDLSAAGNGNAWIQFRGKGLKAEANFIGLLNGLSFLNFTGTATDMSLETNVVSSPSVTAYLVDFTGGHSALRGALKWNGLNAGTATATLYNGTLPAGWEAVPTAPGVDRHRFAVDLDPEAIDARSIGDQFRWLLVSGKTLRTEHVGAATPTGGADGDMKVGNGKIWARDAGVWKSTPLT